MASLYKRPRSPFWWVKYRGADGHVHRESTGLRVGIGPETRSAQRIEAQRTQEELDRPSAQARDEFDAWVEPWIQTHYGSQPHTLTRYLGSWTTVRAFCAQSQPPIHRPCQVLRDHVTQFLRWRQNPPRDSGVRAVARNSAILDLRIWRLIMFEAVARGHCHANPLSRTHLKPDRPAEKPELTDEQIAAVEAALVSKPEWMRVSWAIALRQGCRFSETCLPLSDVDLANGTITFTIKSGVRHTTRLHPDLRPMFAEMKAAGLERTFRKPVGSNGPREWHRFFKRLGMPGVSFHCTRVTAITRLARAGVSQQQAMRFIGHSTASIHKIYQRLQVGDLDRAISALSFRDGPGGIPPCGTGDSPAAS